MLTERLLEIDSEKMYELVKGFPENWKEGRHLASSVEIPFGIQDANQVVVIGMGGSAISGDLLRCFAQETAPVPVQVVRNYTLPASVTSDSIIIASSFSGNTEETLAATREALSRGARVICVTSGGQLEEIAKEKELPVVKIPGGMPPRAALGYSLSVILVIANKIGLISIAEEEWEETITLLEKQTAEYGNLDGSHLAKQIATSLQDRFPLIYSGGGLLESVNLRWRGQIQENSKKMAAGNLFPELNHNEIMGWESVNGDAASLKTGVVVLRDQDDHARVQHRMNVTRDLLSARAGYWQEVNTVGNARLCRMLSLINLGDWVSLYLALLRDVDPTPIGLINKLKEALAKV